MNSIIAQQFGLLVVASIFVVASTLVWMSRRGRLARQVAFPGAVRLVTLAVWLLALSAPYSASAFLWTANAPPQVLDILRFAQLALRTAILIVLIALLVWAVGISRR